VPDKNENLTSGEGCAKPTGAHSRARRLGSPLAAYPGVRRRRRVQQTRTHTLDRGETGFSLCTMGIIPPCFFEIVGPISNVQTIAAGRQIRQLARLKNLYGPGRWRKMKGEAPIRLASGELRRAEVHWYEAHGVGKRNMKFKRYLD